MNLDEIHDQQNHLSLPNPRIAWQKWLLSKIFKGKGWKAKTIEHYQKFLSLWNDPYCLHSLHEERPDLVKKYTRFLLARWKEHLELAKQLTRSKDSTLTPEQLHASPWSTWMGRI